MGCIILLSLKPYNKNSPEPIVIIKRFKIYTMVPPVSDNWLLPTEAFVLWYQHTSQVKLQDGIHRKYLKCSQKVIGKGLLRSSTAFIFNLFCFRLGQSWSVVVKTVFTLPSHRHEESNRNKVSSKHFHRVHPVQEAPQAWYAEFFLYTESLPDTDHDFPYVLEKVTAAQPQSAQCHTQK